MPGVGDALKAEYKAQKLLAKEVKAAGSTAGAVAGEAVESAGRGAAASKGGPQKIEHPSKSAARRAAEREAGMGRHGARENLPEQALRPGSQSPMGDPGVRTETKSPRTGRTVHHDPDGHKKDVIPPHYGVDGPNGTTHHTYPNGHDPRTNR